MAYAAGDTITAAQYNIFVNNSSSPFGYNHFAGTGSGVYGLGQTHIATVAGGNDSATTLYHCCQMSTDLHSKNCSIDT